MSCFSLVKMEKPFLGILFCLDSFIIKRAHEDNEPVQQCESLNLIEVF
jgi:hypothetical protein